MILESQLNNTDGKSFIHGSDHEMLIFRITERVKKTFKTIHKLPENNSE